MRCCLQGSIGSVICYQDFRSVGDRYCRGAHIREVNHPLGGTRKVGALRLHSANMSVRHQLELYRFGSIHNILVSLFREHPATMQGHNVTTW